MNYVQEACLKYVLIVILSLYSFQYFRQAKHLLLCERENYASLTNALAVDNGKKTLLHVAVNIFICRPLWKRERDAFFFFFVIFQEKKQRKHISQLFMNNM